MVQVGEIQWHVSGDVGGVGISRFRFIRQDSGTITGADAHAAAVACQNVLGAGTQWLPTGVTWVCQPEVPIYDAQTGLVQGPLVLGTLPPSVVGGASGAYPAGTGARINWRTSTLHGRRMLKGATFYVPLAGTAYAAGGDISSAVITQINTGPVNYLTAMAAAALEPVVWHRPLKGQTSGGVTGITYSGICSPVPASLRSRRT
jgi:hypothetical protein